MERKGEARSKRKLAPASALDRPAKQMRSEPQEVEEGGLRPGNGRLCSMETDSDDGRLLTLPSGAPDTAEWQATIEAVIRNVVAIRFCQTCPFDTVSAASSEATGFVVDAERGYILTNRHVVCAGPFWGYCIFDNHEEVPLLLDQVAQTEVDTSFSLVRCLSSLP